MPPSQPAELLQAPAVIKAQAVKPQPSLMPDPRTLLPVVRSGRYTLVELVPDPAQRDLLQQIVVVTIPSGMDATVGDAMQHVLVRSGYRLCASPEAAGLFTLPLPAAHLRLGPLVLRDALRTLAGVAWELQVNDLGRQVCFVASGHRAAEVLP